MWYQRGGYQKEAANSLVLLARAQRQEGDYAGALQSFDRQVHLGNQMGDPSLVALARQGSGTVLLAQGRLPEALAAFRQAYEAAHKTGDQLNSEYDLLDEADVYWRLGRYREARQSLGDAGPSPSRAVAALDDQTRGDMALSQRDFHGAMEFAATGARAAEPGDRNDGGGEEHAGRGQNRFRRACRRPRHVGGGRAVGREIGFRAADRRDQVGVCGGAAWGRRSAAGARSGAGRATVVLRSREPGSRMALLAGGVGRRNRWAGRKSQDSIQKAVRILASLQQKWDADENYKTYQGRPDIQDRSRQLSKLTGSR